MFPQADSVADAGTEISSIRLFSGIECAPIGGYATCNLKTTQHWTRYRDDLRRIRDELGITYLRCPVPWHHIAPARSRRAWAWLDDYLATYRELGLVPIADLVHHSAVPQWIRGGFSDVRFADAFTAFTREFAERYQWVEWYTLVNEPFVTAHLCAIGIWPPKGANWHRMIVNMARAMSQARSFLAGFAPQAKIMHTDAASHHEAIDPRLRGKAAHDNHNRFLFNDLALGLVTPDHEFYRHFVGNGVAEAELAWLASHPTKIDVMAFDYYVHSEHVYGDGDEPPSRGMAKVCMDYVDRYRGRFPDMQYAIGEVNVRGTMTDRISWLKYCIEEGERLQALLGDAFFGLGWFPALDCTDWDTLLQEPQGHIDPQGLFMLDPATLDRKSSELTEIFGAYARGEITSGEIPFHPFGRDMHNRPVRLRHLMPYWEEPARSQAPYMEPRPAA